MEIEDVEFAKETKHPSVLVLRALLSGQTVTLEGRKIKLAERVGGGYSPVIISTITSGNGDERPYVLGLDEMTLSYFTKQCEKMTEEEITLLAANTALNEIIREKRLK